MPIFRPSANVTSGPTVASGSSHQFTGSVGVTGSLTVNGVIITGAGGGGGEVNTASNVGGGAGLFKRKDGVDLEFKTLAGSGVTLNSYTSTIGVTASGDVAGPGSATDNAVARFDGTGGKTLQNSGITIDDSNNLTVAGTAYFNDAGSEFIQGDGSFLTMSAGKGIRIVPGVDTPAFPMSASVNISGCLWAGHGGNGLTEPMMVPGTGSIALGWTGYAEMEARDVYELEMYNGERGNEWTINLGMYAEDMVANQLPPNINIGNTGSNVAIYGGEGNSFITIGSEQASTVKLAGHITASGETMISGRALVVSGSGGEAYNPQARLEMGWQMADIEGEIASGSIIVMYAGTGSQGRPATIENNKSGSLAISASNGIYFSSSIGSEVLSPDELAGSIQISGSKYNIFKYAYTGAMVLTGSDLIPGASYLIFLSNSVGTAAVTYDAGSFKFPGGTVPTTTQAQGATDILSGISDGTYIYADMTKAFS